MSSSARRAAPGLARMLSLGLPRPARSPNRARDQGALPHRIAGWPGLFPTRGRGHPRSNCILTAEAAHPKRKPQALRATPAEKRVSKTRGLCYAVFPLN